MKNEHAKTKSWFLAFLILLGAACVPVWAQQAAIEPTDLVARLHLPEEKGTHPGLLVLGGSEGGIEGADSFAQGLVEEGVAVLALAYFKEDGLADQLLQIPLETFERGLDELADNPRVDRERLGILGVSKGAEAALLVASQEPRVRAVVAIVPSHVVWQAVDFGQWRRESSWTDDGDPIEFVPYDTSGGFYPLDKMYRNSLENATNLETATIPVEKISGPILLLSAEDDRIWPSTLMAEKIVERLQAKDFPHPFTHKAYADAGHIVFRAPTRGEIDPKRLEQATAQAGGTPAGTLAAIADSWPRVVAFLREYL